MRKGPTEFPPLEALGPFPDHGQIPGWDLSLQPPVGSERPEIEPVCSISVENGRQPRQEISSDQISGETSDLSGGQSRRLSLRIYDFHS
jgi:hypothetical protein